MLRSKLNIKKLSKGLKTGALTLFLFGFPGLLSLSVAADKKLNNEVLPIEASFIGSNIVYFSDDKTSKIKNNLVFYIRSVSSRSEKKLEQKVIPEIPAIRNESYIKIYFDYGENLGDLLTEANASDFILNIDPNYDNEFNLKKNDRGAGRFSWVLKSKNNVFLKQGSNNKIELTFSDIYSNHKEGVTAMYIEYGNIPGYNNGRLSLPVIKKKAKSMQLKYGLYLGDDRAVDLGGHKLQIDGGVRLQHGGEVNEFSADGSLGSNSDKKIPTQKAVKTYVDNRLPPGVIVMWSGDIDKIPAGWVLCDGNNGTPNLSNTFVFGYGNRAVHETGGQESVALTVDQMPAHKHAITGSVTVNEPKTAKAALLWGLNVYANGASPVNKPVAINISSSGKGQAHNNVPPFYVLAYIMKKAEKIE